MGCCFTSNKVHQFDIGLKEQKSQTKEPSRTEQPSAVFHWGYEEDVGKRLRYRGQCLEGFFNC